MDQASSVEGLAAVERLWQDRSARAKALRAQGKKVMGYFCCAPLELITAADLVPYRITGDMKTPVTRADAHLETIACPFVRSAFDIAIKGDYDFLDGFIIPHGCDSTEGVYEIWDYHLKPSFSHFINVPHTTTPPSMAFCKEEFRTFKRHLEGFVGSAISDDAIREAIELHNRNRALVRELYELNKADPAPVSGAEPIKIVRANKSLPVREANEMLQAVIREIRERKSAGETGRVRLMVYGSELDHPEFIQLIEDAGAQLVTDNICMGLRTYLDDVRITEDPMDGLVHHYLKDITCPRTWREWEGSRKDELDDRFGYLVKMAKEWRVDGVIVFVIRYCDNFAMDVPDVRDYLEGAGLKVLHVESDYAMSHPGQLKTRVQTFVEMLS